MSKTEELKDVFTIFHDGTIEEATFNSKNLVLKVQIEYLAQIIDPSFNQFELTLLKVESLSFKPWTGSTKELTDIKTIFDLDLSITSTQVDEEGTLVIHATCGESADSSYEGGELILRCDDFLIFDQQRNPLNLDELKGHSANYWNNILGTENKTKVQH